MCSMLISHAARRCYRSQNSKNSGIRAKPFLPTGLSVWFGGETLPTTTTGQQILWHGRMRLQMAAEALKGVRICPLTCINRQRPIAALIPTEQNRRVGLATANLTRRGDHAEIRSDGPGNDDVSLNTADRYRTLERLRDRLAEQLDVVEQPRCLCAGSEAAGGAEGARRHDAVRPGEQGR